MTTRKITDKTHYNYYRDYEPTTGRYLQSDPIGLGGGWNTYGYVSANPVNGIDLLGLVNTVVCRADGGMSISLGSDSSGGVCGLSKCLAEHERCHIRDFAEKSDATNFCSDPRNAGKPVEMPANKSNKRFKQETELNGIEEELNCLENEKRKQSRGCRIRIEERANLLAKQKKGVKEISMSVISMKKSVEEITEDKKECGKNVNNSNL